MRDLLENATQRAISYLENLDKRSVAPSPEAVEKLSELNKPLAEEPTSPEQVLALLDEVCSPATMAMAGARFFGFVIGGALPVTLAANWLAGCAAACWHVPAADLLRRDLTQLLDRRCRVERAPA